MKQSLIILFAITTFMSFGQKNKRVELKWKIAKNEKLSYSTVMNDIDTTSIEMDFGGLFKALSDTSDNGLKESKSIFKKFNQAFKNQDYITTLTNIGTGVIEIEMVTRPKETKEIEIDTSESKEAGILKMMQSMSQGVMMRGSVYETGGVHSFWVKNAQKNLISLLFELPTKNVKIGDKWSLDINYLSFDQNFDCDTSYKINEVTLSNIKNINGETIAILKYNIVEFAKGNFNTPAFFGNEGGQSETMMKFTYQGVAEFSVDKGRWIAYDGIMSLSGTELMTGNKRTKFTLIDENNASR